MNKIPRNDHINEKLTVIFVRPAEINSFTHPAYILETSGTTGKRKCNSF